MRARLIRWSWTSTALVVAAVALSAWTTHLQEEARSPLPVGTTLRWSPIFGLLAAPGETPLAPDDIDLPVGFSLQRGQTLAGALSAAGVDGRESHLLVAAMGDHVDPRRMLPGERGDVWFDDSRSVSALQLDLPGRGHVRVERDGDGEYAAEWVDAVRAVEIRSLAGSLDRGSLEAAVVGSGGDPRVAYALADVFQWDLDFNRDLRTGDRFEIVYEEVRLDGELVGPGAIRAAVYENRGQRLEAYRFEDGYYDAEGRPAEKMFLKSPLPFTRVTSRFTNRRFHPVLKVHRPHYGVDYGAPTGTPVRATASGTVDFAGRSGGAGNMVKVRHPNGYLTAYLHLSGFAKGVRRGARVRQGDVIGYVGSTGLSTGPHLDYRVQKSGRWIDPLGMRNVPAPPIPDERRREFLVLRDELRTLLHQAEPPARADSELPTAVAAL